MEVVTESITENRKLEAGNMRLVFILSENLTNIKKDCQYNCTSHVNYLPERTK